MQSIKKKIACALLFGLALPLSAHAALTIENGYVLAGVSDFGTLGSNGTKSPGLLFDSTGTGNYGVNDFLTPGTPFAGFYITALGNKYHSNNTGDTKFNGFTLTQNSPTSVTATGISKDGLLGVTNTYSIATIGERSVINVTTTLTNYGTSSLTDLAFLFAIDPDPDANVYSVFDTDNKILSDDQVCASGLKTGETLCLYTDSDYAHKAGVKSDWNWFTLDPADFLSGVNAGNGDHVIGLGFALGDLAGGGSLDFSLSTVLGGSLEIAVGEVPEPLSTLLVACGLLGIAGFGRRKGS